MIPKHEPDIKLYGKEHRDMTESMFRNPTKVLWYYWIEIFQKEFDKEPLLFKNVGRSDYAYDQAIIVYKRMKEWTKTHSRSKAEELHSRDNESGLRSVTEDSSPQWSDPSTDTIYDIRNRAFWRGKIQ